MGLQVESNHSKAGSAKQRAIDSAASSLQHGRRKLMTCPVSGSELFESLVEHPGLLVIGVDTEGRLLWASEGFEQMTGYRFEEVRGLDWVQTFMAPEARERAAAHCRGGIGQDRSKAHIEPLLLKDGSIRQVEWVHSDLRDAEGRVTGILCVGRDLTELMAAREALMTSERRSRAIVETAVNAIITMSEACIIETVNSATERMFGYSRSELVGGNIRLLMPEPYRQHHDGYVQHYLRTGQRRIIGIGREAVGQRKDGSIFPIDLSVGEVLLADGRRVFTGIIRDLTERKQLEEQILHISELEQQRIGQDIHDDLCQQLAAIGCLAKVAHQKLLKAHSPQAANLDEIVRLLGQAATRAREMSRGLMPVVLDGGGLAAALAELGRSTERIFRISCPLHLGGSVEVENNSVAVQLYRIAQEAVANAVKHSRADRLELSLSQQEGSLCLSISDNGVGLPAQPQAGGGMGLLTMSHRARMLGGVLTIDPLAGGGTVVRCQVPLTHPQTRAESRT
jgi:PAS domain S-box-containing protein